MHLIVSRIGRKIDLFENYYYEVGIHETIYLQIICIKNSKLKL